MTEVPADDVTTTDATPQSSGRILLVVDAGSVISKPDYVDLVEVAAGARPPIVTNHWV